jgi:hypothetical protein
MNGFLSTLLKTRVFQELYWYLVRNNFIYPDKVRFRVQEINITENRGELAISEKGRGLIL